MPSKSGSPEQRRHEECVELIAALRGALQHVARSGSEGDRELIKQICHRFMNELYDEYGHLEGVLQDMIDDLYVLEEHGGVSEPRIMHLSTAEAQQIFKRLYGASEKT